MPYVLTRNRPGYLPEADPTELELDGQFPAAPQILEAILNEVEFVVPDYGLSGHAERQWRRVLDQVHADRERAAEFNPRNGFRYDLPDGEVLEVTYL